MALGGICGSLLGGYALSNFLIDTIFLLFSVLPTIQLISCQFVKETSVHSKTLQEYSMSRDSLIDGSASDENSHLVYRFSSSSTRRKKGKKKSKSMILDTKKSKILEKDISLVLQWFRSIKEAIYDLCRAFRQPMILR